MKSSSADSVSLTLGSKFEHNAFTGFEYEPSAQLVWTPSVRNTVWVSAARAIRQPSLADVGLRVDLAVVPLSGGAFAVPVLLGNPQMKAEQLRDYEAGYRSQLSRRLSLDVTAFWSFYRRLATGEPQAPFFTFNPGPPHLVFPTVFDNLAHAENYGAELFATWDVSRRWRISPGYSLLRMSVKRDPSSRDSTVEQIGGESPAYQLQVRSWLKLRKNVDWDSTLMYVSGRSRLAIPSYARLDTRLGWRLGEFVEISIVGQNLLRSRHLEFFDTTGLVYTPSRAQRVRKDNVALLIPTEMTRMLSLILLLGAALADFAHRRPPPAFDEYQVKAAFLYNFAKFVEWPPGTFANSTDPIGICIVGQNPFGSALENMVQGKKVGDRAFAVRRLPDTQQASQCQILFIGAGEWKRTRFCCRD